MTHVYAYNFDSKKGSLLKLPMMRKKFDGFGSAHVDRRMMYADHYDIILWAYKNTRRSQY